MENKKIESEIVLEDVALYKYLVEKRSPFVSQIGAVYNKVKNALNTRLPSIFPTYTLHDTQHSFRIMNYMYDIVNNVDDLSEIEVAIMIYTALLHDIGMAAEEKNIELIKKGKPPYNEIKFSIMKRIHKGNEVLALQEYIRRIHARMSANYIRTYLKDAFLIPNQPMLNFTNDIAKICESHTEDFDWIKSNIQTNKKVLGDYTFNPQYLCCILRLGDILDIDSNRTPYNLYKLISPKDTSDDEWRKNFSIFNNKKIKINPKTGLKRIEFHGECSDVSIHRKILQYIYWVERELNDSVSLTMEMLDQYVLNFELSPDFHIQPLGYTFSDYKMTLDFRAISQLLMGEKIYGERSLGLREIIQNSIDACMLRKEQADKNQKLGEEPFVPKIKIIINEETNSVIVKDNGIGMTSEIIKKHFLNIGVSYYNSMDFLLKDYEYKPIGNFGIGFLSCFMLSNKVKVLTRHFKSKLKYKIDIEKASEYISLTEYEDVEFEGTEVILNLSEFLDVFDNKSENIILFLEKFFLTENIEFELIKKKFTIKIINNLERPITNVEFKIDFKNYLKEIEGFAYITNNNSFIKTMEDIDFDGEPYIIKNGKLIEVENLKSLKISDFVKGDTINFLRIPIVPFSLERKYQSGLEFTTNVSTVIEKMDWDLDWISILLPKNFKYNVYSKEIDRNLEIYQNIYFEDLEMLGHSMNCPTIVFFESHKIFEGVKDRLYISYGDYSNYNYNFSSKKLYIRNVLIKDFLYSFPVQARLFNITYIGTNVRSKKIIPNISRNNIDDLSKEILNYTIGKAIHKGVTEVINLTNDERKTLEDFTKKFFKKRSFFEK